MGRQMLLSELLLNPSVPAEDEKRLSRQAIHIYNQLLKGPVWTNHLVTIARQYNARIFELRQWLAPQGLTIDCTDRDVHGNRRFEVCEYEGSNYQALQRKRGIE